MIRFFRLLVICLLCYRSGYGRPLSFRTFTNPVIPGDHPDCTLSRIGNDFYTTGSSFATTPIIYHSTDLLHWEAISHPVLNSWTQFGSSPTDGCWGGHLVVYNNKYWHFFGHAGTMYFVTAVSPAGPWSSPRAMSCPAAVPGLGMDDSIFIDDDGRWFLLVKNGQSNNWILELGGNGQPAGAVYNLCWINPAPDYPFSWAEGPVMWKQGGYYYYCFAINIYATQRIFRSSRLTGDQAAWEYLGNFFDENDPQKGSALYSLPNHCSPAIVVDDSTSWVMYHSYGPSDWQGQGRQGLLSQVRYDAAGLPVADFPINAPRTAPALPGGGIPWMVPKSDFFDSDQLNPEWRLLGYSPASPYSLTDRPGWIRLSPKNAHNTIIKNDAEHNYSLITRLDFDPQSTSQEAGLRIMTGLQTRCAKLFSSMNSAGKKVVRFSYEKTVFEYENSIGTILWLKLVRVNHVLSGYFGSDGCEWNQVGDPINIATMDAQQTDYNAFTGNHQGLYVIGKSADFDLYIYRDAYTPILAECYTCQYGLSRSYNTDGYVLDNIHAGDWAMYGGVEFGHPDYDRTPDSLTCIASCATNGGTFEVWIDSLDTGLKIAECAIGNTGGLRTFRTFTAVAAPVSGRHDVFLKFAGTDAGKLFQLRWLSFTAKPGAGASAPDRSDSAPPSDYRLGQNHPNPFNPLTRIGFRIPGTKHVSIKIYNVLGEEVAELADREYDAGDHSLIFDASQLSAGVFFYTLRTEDFINTRKMVLLK